MNTPRASSMCLLLLCLAGCRNGEDEVAPPGDAAAPDAAGDSALDAGASNDGAGEPPRCVESNTAAAIATRDGFVEVCADPATSPGAVCGDGSPYKMSYRRAAGPSAGLLLYFRGGGACTDYVSCWGNDGLGGEGRRVATLENTFGTAPNVATQIGHAFGIMDATAVDNPMSKYDVAWISYCSGDGGLGDSEEEFAKPATALPGAPGVKRTFFHGKQNTDFAIATARETFPSAKAVVVMGSSAGAYSAMGAVDRVTSTFASATDFAVVVEGGVGVARADFESSAMATIKAYDGTRPGKPRVRFGHVTFSADATQRSFVPPQFQSASAFAAEARRIVEARSSASPTNFRYFVPSGTCHTFLQSPALYQQFKVVGKVSKPVQPTVSPNPDLLVDAVPYVSWLKTVVASGAPFGSLPNAANWEAADVCPLPGPEGL